MKLNNKGMTMVELIVSVALISVVLLFLYNLLSSVTFERNNDFIANSNQANRIDIVTTIEDDLICDNITSYNISGKNLTLTGENTYEISYYTVKENDKNIYKLQYKVKGEIKKTWTINKAKIEDIICTDIGDGALTNKLYTCSFIVTTSNKNNSVSNNNTLDDITLTFANKVE